MASMEDFAGPSDSMESAQFAGQAMMQQQMVRSAMEGLIVVGVMAGISGESVFSRNVLVTGLMAGLGLYIVDSYAPQSGEALRFGLTTGRL